MKKLLFILVLFTFIGCNNIQDPSFMSNNVDSISITSNSNLETSLITFESWKDFENAVNEISKLNTDSAKNEWVHNHYPNFTSLQNIYRNAMNEMATLDDIDLNQFKAFENKYKALYFPHIGEDGGFYIPIKDTNKAYLTNSECKISIAGEIVSIKDIDDYEDLVSTGRAYYPSSIPMLVGSQLYFSNTNQDPMGTTFDSGWKQYGDRKVLFKSRRLLREAGKDAGTIVCESRLHLEFCFRKKVLGVWVNYSSWSSFSFSANESNKGWTEPFVCTHDENSSHDSEVFIPLAITDHGNDFCYTYPSTQFKIQINFRGVNELLNYSWTFPSEWFYAPKNVIILPRC